MSFIHYLVLLWTTYQEEVSFFIIYSEISSRRNSKSCYCEKKVKKKKR